MKNRLVVSVVVSLLVITSSLFAQKALNRIGASGPLDFNKTSFNLAWSDKPNATYYVQEYVPKGERVENFTQMLTVNVFDKDITIEDAVQQKAKWLNERKKTDDVCNFQVTNNPDKTEYMVDFIVSEKKGDDYTIVEFNVYRYKKVDIGNGKKGILVYVYSQRSYGEEITDFLQNLGETRTGMLNAMIASVLPAITLLDK